MSFVHKSNPLNTARQPKARVWCEKSEGLALTAKGSKDLAGRRRLHLLVAISFNHGVILREVYQSMNETFASFGRNHFPLRFARVGFNCRRLFVMDNEPYLWFQKSLKWSYRKSMLRCTGFQRDPHVLTPLKTFFISDEAI